MSDVLPLPQPEKIPPVTRDMVIRAFQGLTMEEEALVLRDVLKLHEMPPEKLREMILRIGPEGEVRAGKRMLLRLLDSGGTDGVADFVAKAQVALRHNDGLDVKYDFDPLEAREFRRSHSLSRRTAIQAVCFGIPGILYTSEGVSDLMSKVTNPEATIHKFFESAQHSLQEVHWISNTLIGIGLFHEAFIEKAREYKLEQVADLVAELVERRNQENQRGR